MEGEKRGGIDKYRSELRRPVRGLWTGVIDTGQFFEQMELVIRAGLESAWNSGAQSVGIAPDELTPEELLARDNAILNELTYLPDFATAIAQNDRANGGS